MFFGVRRGVISTILLPPFPHWVPATDTGTQPKPSSRGRPLDARCPVTVRSLFPDAPTPAREAGPDPDAWTDTGTGSGSGRMDLPKRQPAGQVDQDPDGRQPAREEPTQSRTTGSRTDGPTTTGRRQGKPPRTRRPFRHGQHPPAVEPEARTDASPADRIRTDRRQEARPGRRQPVDNSRSFPHGL